MSETNGRFQEFPVPVIKGRTAARAVKKLFFLFSFYFSLFLYCLLPSSLSFAFDRPFNNAANWGGTGLLETPTARILEDGVVRVGVAQASPYRWYSMGMGIFPGLEFSGRLTRMEGVSTALGPDYGAYKDKAFDLKYQILPESKKLPAVAIGLHDFWGTALFRAQYVVLSRQIFPFDFTLGIGRGRLGDEPLDHMFSIPSPREWWDQIKVFGGIEWALTERLHLLAEYNPIDYQKDVGSAGRAVPEGAKSPINVGLRFKVVPGLDLGISYQRGDTLGLMCHLQFLLGDPVLPQRPDPPLRHSVDRRPFSRRDLKEMVDKIYQAIYKQGFKDATVYTDGKSITAEVTNGRYLSNQKAVGRILRILLFYSPEDARELTVILKASRMPLLEVSVKPDHLEKYLLGKISPEIFKKLIRIETVKKDYDARDMAVAEKKDPRPMHFNLGVKPSLITYLNDPSGFFKYRVGVKPYAITYPWKGAAAYGRFDAPLYSNISSSNIPPPDAVRSDSWKYLDRDYTFDRLIFNQEVRLTDHTFGRLSAGYFEYMYAGVGGEILTYLLDGKLAIGIESDWARKREPGTLLDLADFEAHTVLGNLYYRLSPFDTTVQAQYGRFLGKDVGWRFIVSREYSTGVVLGAWISFTDTDHFTGYNKDYNDKGVFLSLPARMLLTRDSASRYYYAISPWTRDVAQAVRHWKDLYGLASDLTPALFKEDLDKLKK